MELLRRSIASIAISLLVSAVIIGSLFFLYRIIKRQKELSEIKNDLINNITHEFKTPIATVLTAIEAIENFDAQQDPQRKGRYLDISREQLKKLNLMVEKLLETSTLDSDQIDIQKERIDLLRLLAKLTEKFSLLKGDKTLEVTSSETSAVYDGDPFHLENAIGNIIDNAIKYGGDSIKVSLRKTDRLIIEISDNGGNLKTVDKDLIFDKFYRVPQGNVHDVKGFGIGLYYTKKVIEKHGGSIQIAATDRETVFKISL
jgi:two-component system phosphate regulon sensor histidine kinase PhoR